MEYSREEYWSGLPFPSPGDLPKLGIKPRFPTLQADALSAEPPGKPKNTGVGSLSLLQQIFPTLESNWGLLHCRWILYQLSHQEALSYLEGQLIFRILFPHSGNLIVYFPHYSVFPYFTIYNFLLRLFIKHPLV